MRIRHFLRPDWFLRIWALACCLGIGLSILAQTPAASEPAPGTTNSAASTLELLGGTDREFIRNNRSLLTFGLDQVGALQIEFFHRPLWQYLATVVYVILAFQISKLFDWLIHIRLKKWASGTSNRWDDVLIGLLDGPVKVISFVVFLNIGLQLFDWPEVVERWISKLTYIGVGVSLLVVVLKAVDAVIGLWRSKLPDKGDRAFNEHFLVLVGKVAKAVITVVAVFTVLGNLGFDIRTALASVSVIGLALGLAAQDTVANLFGAVAVFFDKPFKIGDRVRIGDADGTVEEMGLRSTRIRNLEGFLITVPNKEVGNSRVVNITRRPTIRTNFTIGLTYDTSAARMQEAVQLAKSILSQHPQTADVVVYFARMADFSLNIDVIHWCKTTDWRQYTEALQEMNLELKGRFDAAGLKFAFPTRTVEIIDATPAGTKLPGVGSDRGATTR